MIYFIHAPAMDAVKIGVTNDPKRRLTLLQTGSPCELKLLATEDGDADKERELHRRFSEFRTRREWFSYGKPIADYVATLQPLPAEPKRERWLTDLAEKCGISKGYASQLVNGQRVSIEAILHVFTTVGWRHPLLDGFDDDTLRLLSERFPYVKRQAA